MQHVNNLLSDRYNGMEMFQLNVARKHFPRCTNCSTRNKYQ